MVYKTINKKEIKDFFKEADQIVWVINYVNNIIKSAEIKVSFFAIIKRALEARDVQAWFHHIDLFEKSIEAFTKIQSDS